jgi:hypothetical protein
LTVAVQIQGPAAPIGPSAVSGAILKTSIFRWVKDNIGFILEKGAMALLTSPRGFWEILGKNKAGPLERAFNGQADLPDAFAGAGIKFSVAANG